MAKAVKLAHEKYPEYLIGDMNVFMTKYPFTCNPEDVLATQKEMRIMPAERYLPDTAQIKS